MLLWVIALVIAAMWEKLHLGGDFPLWVICGGSGLVTGFAVRFALRGSSHRTGSSFVWLYWIFAGIGVDRLMRGDSGGMINVLLYGGLAIGSWIGTKLPVPVTVPDDSLDDLDEDWDEV